VTIRQGEAYLRAELKVRIQSPPAQSQERTTERSLRRSGSTRNVSVSTAGRLRDVNDREAMPRPCGTLNGLLLSVH
jgi:hypothetical protein